MPDEQEEEEDEEEEEDGEEEEEEEEEEEKDRRAEIDERLEQEEFRYRGYDVEIEEYTDDTDESPYVAYPGSVTNKLLSDRLAWQKFRFIATLVILILSMTLLIIVHPLYVESLGTVSNAYTGLLFTSFVTANILGVIYFVAERVSPPLALAPGSMRVKIERQMLLKIGTAYMIAGVLITLALDRNRVLCHLQDPIKGITLVFSMIYYFFFCRKMMSLQRIFSSTTIIVGLFISVDYELCDEFRCRGREVSEHTSMKTKGSWGIRAVWTLLYVAALGAFAIVFTLLERHYTTEQSVCQIMASQQTSLLHTVSRLVSSRDIRRRNSAGAEEAGRLLHVTDPDPSIKPKQPPKPPILETLFYLHVIAFLGILAFCWLDMLPGIGRGLSATELYRIIARGLVCHWTDSGECANIFGHGWTFLVAYVIFAISVLNFLAISESAVFSVAASTVSLPLSGIWWSIYRMDIGAYGSSISWAPGVTGELICALLGLPVVLLGLGLLVRSHFKDTFPSDRLFIQPTVVRELGRDLNVESYQR